MARLQRAEQLPEIPTLDELGYPGFDVTTWYGLCTGGHAGGDHRQTCQRICNRTARPDVKAKLWLAEGAEVFYLPRKQFVAYLADDANRLKQLIKTTNITGE